jgi:hypothetical protein
MSMSKETAINKAMQTVLQEIALVRYSPQQTDLNVLTALRMVYEAGRAQGIRDSIEIVERNHINSQEVA